jgi:uncharacterized protein YabN with tetrapyrrole methylase and pyrophosphatase domain
MASTAPGATEDAEKAGSLTVVGVGIKLAAQTSLEAKAHIEAADKVIFLVTDPGTEYWLQSLNPSAESLHRFYEGRDNRLSTYLEMTEYILNFVRDGLDVCAAFYGHPGIFVFPSHRAIQQARSEGFRAAMLAGISAEDCLFADIGFDPATSGCQSFEATDFLVHERTFDPRSNLILWQIGVIGEIGYNIAPSAAKLNVLVDRLSEIYPSDHKVTVYEAARYPICDPTILTLPLSALSIEDVSPISTLYVPPLGPSIPNLAVVEALGIPQSYVKRKTELTLEDITKLGIQQ